MDALQRDYTTAPVSDQDRVMLNYVVTMTKDATKIHQEDHDTLHAAGFDDKATWTATKKSPRCAA